MKLVQDRSSENVGKYNRARQNERKKQIANSLGNNHDTNSIQQKKKKNVQVDIKEKIISNNDNKQSGTCVDTTCYAKVLEINKLILNQVKNTKSKLNRVNVNIGKIGKLFMNNQ